MIFTLGARSGPRIVEGAARLNLGYMSTCIHGKGVSYT